LPLLIHIWASVRNYSSSPPLDIPAHATYPETSRRDDLESLAYMLIYFIRGTLPWRKLRSHPTPPTLSNPNPTPFNHVSATWDLIRDSKVTHENLLTAGLPAEFDVLYRYARGLEFDDLPDYEGLRELFRGLAKRMDVTYDGVFDWTVPSHGSGRKMSGGGGRRFCEACNARKR
jgi:casein kinase I family protein HRR25